MAFKYTKIQLPGYDNPEYNFEIDRDENYNDLEGYLKNYIEKGALFYFNGSNLVRNGRVSNSWARIENATPPLALKATQDNKFAKFWKEYIAPILKENSKVFEAETILKNYSERGSAYAANPKGTSKGQYFSNTNKLDTSKPAFQTLLKATEANSMVNGFDGDIRSYPMSKIKPILDELEGLYDRTQNEELLDFIADIKQSAMEAGKGSKVYLPLKLSISNLIDIDKSIIEGDTVFYTQLQNIPRNEKELFTITPGGKNIQFSDTERGRRILRQNYLSDIDFYPEGDLGEYLEVWIDIQKAQNDRNNSAKFTIEAVPYKEQLGRDSAKRIHRLNLEPKRENTVEKLAKKYQEYTSMTFIQYMKLLEQSTLSGDKPKFLTQDLPDDIIQLNPSIANRPLVIPKRLFEGGNLSTSVSDQDFLKSLKSSSIVRSKISGYIAQIFPIEERRNKLYLGPNLSKALIDQDFKKLRKYLYVDKNGNVKRHKQRKFGGQEYGLVWEHLVPFNSLGEIAVQSYEYLVGENGMGSEEFLKVLKPILTGLYTEVWLDTELDGKLTNAGFQRDLGYRFMKDIGSDLIKGIPDKATLDNAIERYARLGIANADDIKPFNEIFPGATLRLSKIKNQQMALEKENYDQLAEEKPISLLELLGY